MSFYERLEKLMKNVGISQGKLEKAIHIGNGSVNKWREKNSTPRYDTLVKLANYFNVSVDYLTGKEEGTIMTESAHLVMPLSEDKPMSEALSKYFRLSDVKKKHVVELINLLSE